MSGEKSIFELTSSHLNTGMRGIPVGTCRTSFVTPTEGVHYCGYPISELASMLPEDIVYLLFNKELPNEEQSTAFQSELQSRGKLPSGVEEVLASLPKDGHPMDWLSIGIHTLGMLGGDGDWKEDALNLVARMPRLLGLIFRYREGRIDDIPEDDLSLSLVGRFTNTLDLHDVDKSVMDQVISTYVVLHMDHGGGNLSTFTGKAVASGHATIYSSMAGAMNALSGPLHGRANQSCFEFSRRLAPMMPKKLKHLLEENWKQSALYSVSVMLCLGRKTQGLQFNSLWAKKSVLMMNISRQFEFLEKWLLECSQKIRKSATQMPMLTLLVGLF